MAVSLGPVARGGKRVLDAELNLVPFIDLLVCCICFLLLTAVWVELAAVRARTGGRGGEGRSDVTPVSVLVGTDGYTLNVGPQRRAFLRHGLVYDDVALSRELRALHATVGEKPITVAAEDGVPYRQLVRAMDLVHGASFSEITVSDGRGLL